MKKAGIVCIVITTVEIDADKVIIMRTFERILMSFPKLEKAFVYYNGHATVGGKDETNGRWDCVKMQEMY